MSVSVLTLVKGRAGHLAQLLEGLRRNTAPPDEIVIVDMNDQPGELPARPFACRHLHLPGPGLPLAKARNLAARAAHGDHLLFLDVDCIPMRHLVSAMTTQLAAQDALICAEIRYLGPADARGPWTEADLHRTAQPHPVRAFPATGAAPLQNPGLFWSLAFGIRRSRFKALNGFDEAFTGYGAEDTDFAFRAHHEKTPMALLGGAADGIGAFHQHHQVFDPPIQHFADIVRNAKLFHARWNIWPMEGWLADFAKLGLVETTNNDIIVSRQPMAQDFARAKTKDRKF